MDWLIGTEWPSLRSIKTDKTVRIEEITCRFHSTHIQICQRYSHFHKGSTAYFEDSHGPVRGTKRSCCYRKIRSFFHSHSVPHSTNSPSGRSSLPIFHAACRQPLRNKQNRNYDFRFSQWTQTKNISQVISQEKHKIHLKKKWVQPPTYLVCFYRLCFHVQIPNFDGEVIPG